ncbi:hypothetical protein ACHAWF_017720 [Thalassiosira exigua]
MGDYYNYPTGVDDGGGGSWEPLSTIGTYETFGTAGAPGEFFQQPSGQQPQMMADQGKNYGHNRNSLRRKQIEQQQQQQVAIDLNQYYSAPVNHAYQNGNGYGGNDDFTYRDGSVVTYETPKPQQGWDSNTNFGQSTLGTFGTRQSQPQLPPIDSTIMTYDGTMMGQGQGQMLAPPPRPDPLAFQGATEEQIRQYRLQQQMEQQQGMEYSQRQWQYQQQQQQQLQQQRQNQKQLQDQRSGGTRTTAADEDDWDATVGSATGASPPEEDWAADDDGGGHGSLFLDDDDEATCAETVDGYGEDLPPTYPPVRTTRKSQTISSRLAAPIRNPPKVAPGRLFLRMPVPAQGEGHPDPSFRLGEFVISIELTELEGRLVERAKRKVERRARKEERRNPGYYDANGLSVYDSGDEMRPPVGGMLEQRDDVEADHRAMMKELWDERERRKREVPRLASLAVRYSPRSGRHEVKPKTIWSSAPGVNFVGAASLSSVDISNDGTVSENFQRVYDIQTIDAVRRGPSDVVTILGQLGHAIIDGGLPEDSPCYALSFRLVPNEPRALSFSLRVEGGEIMEIGRAAIARQEGGEEHPPCPGRFYDFSANSAQIFLDSPAREAYYGLGARTSRPDLRGLEVTVCHPSYGGGAGSGSNGRPPYSEKQTANPSAIPHCVSSSGVSLHLSNGEPTIFDFASPGWRSVRTPCSVLAGTFLAADSIFHAMELHTAMVGRTRPPPGWTQRNGVIAGVQGGTAAVRDVCRTLFKYRCPVAGVLVRDWTGIKTVEGGACGTNPSWYNYVLEREHYTGWGPLVDSLERRGINVGISVSPYLEEIPPVLRSGRRYLFGEAGEDCFVKKEVVRRDGKDGAPVVATALHNQFKKTKCGVLDPTRHEAAAWFKQVLREEVLQYAGASFWLADLSAGGPPVDGAYASDPHDGHGLPFHNAYAEEWSRLNREAVAEAGRDGDGFVVVNAAYGSAAKHAGCTSLGDHVPCFRRDGGGILRAVLNGIVNGGFSGLTHGHCAVCVSVPRGLSTAVGSDIDAKSREMICRWMEMTAFTTLFRTHDGDGGDAEAGGGKGRGKEGRLCAYYDPATVRALVRWSRVYIALAEYRTRLLNEASFRGWPVVRHPTLHFPHDENFFADEGGSGGNSASAMPAFMMGDLIYMAPVLRSGVVKKRVYLPEGAWIHLWTMEEVAGPHNIGKTVEVRAPLGEPPVFVRDHDDMRRFMATLQQKGIIKLGRVKGKKGRSLFSSWRRRE